MRPESRIPINTLTYVDAETGERRSIGPPVSRRESLIKTMSNNKPVVIFLAVNYAIVAGLGILAIKSCQDSSDQSTFAYSSQER